MDLERLKWMVRVETELNLLADLVDGIAGDFRDMGYPEIADLYTQMWRQVCMNADDLDRKVSGVLLSIDEAI